MDVKSIYSIRLAGVEPVLVCCECQIMAGFGLHLVGMVDAVVKESLLRTVTALVSFGYHVPGKKIVINLAPADLIKCGRGYDLPIALSLISATGQEELPELEKWLVLGELGLDGSVRYVPGFVQAVITAKEKGLKGCIIPKEGVVELENLVNLRGFPVFAVSTLKEAVEIINEPRVEQAIRFEREADVTNQTEDDSWSLLTSAGTRRALEIAAAGGHDLLMVGAPGSGKATSAKALRQLLPPMTDVERVETAKVYSAAGSGRYMSKKDGRPLRSPHISCSIAAMIGGGVDVLPGEVSLAHNGVLFLDDVAEMPKSLQEVLRVPMEDKQVVISRLANKVTMPAKFHLIAAMNPCPCGYYGEGDRCTCTKAQREAYMNKMSGVFFDHIDMQLWVRSMPSDVNAVNIAYEPVSVVAERVKVARKRQMLRQGKLNGELSTTELAKCVPMGNDELHFLEEVIARMGLSARAYSRLLKIAITIADLEGSDCVKTQHIAEAASFRFLDRTNI